MNQPPAMCARCGAPLGAAGPDGLAHCARCGASTPVVSAPPAPPVNPYNVTPPVNPYNVTPPVNPYNVTPPVPVGPSGVPRPILPRMSPDTRKVINRIYVFVGFAVLIGASAFNILFGHHHATHKHGPYGAIAYDAQSGGWGMSAPLANKASADQSALTHCGHHGHHCAIVLDFSHTCAALATGSGHAIAWAEATTSAAARARALSACADKAKGTCNMRYWHCYP